MNKECEEYFTIWLANVAPWQYFATLTYGEKWGEHGPSHSRSMVHVASWLRQNQVNRAFYVAETGPRGFRTHNHCLLYGHGSLTLEPSWEDLRSSWLKRFGIIRLDKVTEVKDVGWYVTKYLWKDQRTLENQWDLHTLERT